MELLKLLSANEIVAQVVSFLIFFAVMKKFLWKKVLELLDARKEAIAADYRKIETANESLARLKEAYCKKIAEIDVEARARITEARIEGERVAGEIRMKANLEGERLIENVRASLKDEIEKAKEDLKDTIVDLSIDVAEKIMQEKLSEENDRRLVEDFVREIEKK